MRKTIFIFFQVLLSCLAEAQEDQFNFINFSSNNGLSSNIVNAVYKDRLGYMWFASEDGLNRFDGSSFTVYNHNAFDSTSIGTNQLQTIYEDPQGRLWVGTNRTLSLYDRQKDYFSNYNITNGTGIRSITSDGAGHLWIGSYAGLILAKLDELGIRHHYYEYPGGHTWPVWRNDLYHFAQLLFK